LQIVPQPHAAHSGRKNGSSGFLVDVPDNV
jgi:hypothetical protein